MKAIETNSDLIPEAFFEGTALTVRLRGEVDLHTSPDLRDSLLSLVETHKAKRVIINLAEVPYMDSSAIAVLVELLQRMRKDNGAVYLAGLQPRVKGLMEIARLDRIFKIVATEKEAMA